MDATARPQAGDEWRFLWALEHGPLGLALLNRAQPTYYGAAWVALGRLLLTTRRLDVRPC
jgi:hypothetical protein